VQHLIGIAVQFLFYLTPIVYTLDRVPKDVHGIPVADVVRFNPLSQFVAVTRDILYKLELPAAVDMLGLVAYSLASLAIGWAIFRRFAPDLSEEM
jgi:ABC-type polysaccharide/polyol phosphate export permease